MVEDKNLNEWLDGKQLGIDIVKRKYLQNDETFEEWINRISGGDEDVKRLILEKKFLPGGRILANRGLSKNGIKSSLSNCYVLSVDDSIESIYECCAKMARTYSFGGGVGIDISKLRPRGAKVKNTAKETTGAVSFMKTFDVVTGTIGQSGRRGALMISISVNHPDVYEFVDVKANTDEINNANISIRVNDEFMKAVDEDKDYLLHWPCDMTISEKELDAVENYNELVAIDTASGPVYVKKIKAKDLFNKLVKNNWDYAEPGILYWDRIEKYHLMSENKDFQYAGTNPCVIGSTKILTDEGYVEIESVAEKYINVWNGFEWSEVKPRLTGENQHTLIIEFTDGGVVQCTDYHKWLLDDGRRVEASELVEGNTLATWNEPVTGRKKASIVKSINDGGVVDKVYCMTEPKNHTFIANGYITGNCAEEPLPNGGACLLGSCNLYMYVGDNRKFDYDTFAKDCKIMTKALNDIQIEGTPLHPLDVQKETAKKYRQIGLGLFDLGGALIKMNIRYGSPESREVADKITHTMLISAFEESCDLNEQLGIHAVYDNMFDSEFYKTRIEPFIDDKYKGKYPLNSQLLTIAPTGTISTMINATSGGGEPMFAVSYTRNTKSIGEKAYTVYPQAVLDYYGGDESKIDENNLPECFITAGQLDPKERVLMQATLQKNIDASISSTVNLNEKTTVEEVYDIYMNAWKEGLKGITIFRDNCKRAAILTTSAPTENNVMFNTVDAPKRPKVLDADFYQVRVNGENFRIFVGLYDGKPYELFAMPCANCEKIPNHKGKITRVKKRVYKYESEYITIDNIAIELDKDYDIFGEIDKISDIVNEGKTLKKSDTEIVKDSVYNIKEWSEKREYRNVALHISGNLRTGMRLEDIIKLEDKCNDNIVSFNKAVSRVLSKYLKNTENNEVCPECGGTLINEGGCIHCVDCGWSRCS